MTTVGETLIRMLEAHGVEIVFGIPGVHTVELYRGLAGSRIRHVTARHEQGAAFMADGYARVSGKPGVALLITGPGLTNALTAMAQARADSVPMLVITGVNASQTLGRGLGYLHELPDQRGMTDLVALYSQRIQEADQLPGALRRAFSLFRSQRPGPVHIEIPLDVMTQPADGLEVDLRLAGPPAVDPGAIEEAARRADQAMRPLIIAGGGARHAEAELVALAERLDAPVVTTVNARGLMHRHPLLVPASPSLRAVRALMADCDFALALGTELGPTDFDMYADGGLVLPKQMVRIDIDRWQLSRRPAALTIQSDSKVALSDLLDAIGPRRDRAGKDRAGKAAVASRIELTEPMRHQLSFIEAIRDSVPECVLVGDSTQPVYAANLFYDHDRPGGWFNAATGYGALGYGPPAAIGARLAAPDAKVVCIAGDGGFQFTMAELAVAAENRLPVIFVVWNNRGYREIEESMRAAGVEPVGVSPSPPDFAAIAAAYALPFERVADVGGLASALIVARDRDDASLIEISVE